MPIRHANKWRCHTVAAFAAATLLRALLDATMSLIFILRRCLRFSAFDAYAFIEISRRAAFHALLPFDCW